MSEVEKLYELARANKKCFDKRYEKCTGVCLDCEYFIYPPFTAEKQLELIKWLATTRQIHITCLLDNWIIEDFIRYAKKHDSFENALAGFINNLWQNLTDTEKAEIKRILENE